MAAAGAAAVLCAWAPRAGAEVGAPGATVQAVAADAQFLEYAPPPAAPGVVCLIDSGVDPNPDTTPILAGSYAMEPGTDTSDELSKVTPPLEPGNHPDGHGTYMAMIMAAPVNGWGMVGIAPTSVKVFNLKALAPGQGTFSFAAYANAIAHCASGPVGVSDLSVINLSLSSDVQPTQSDVGALSLGVDDARRDGIAVVGAAGNGGGAIGYPAAVSGVLSVGGTDVNPSNLGVFCDTSNRGAGLGILAPGCGTQNAAGRGGNGIEVAFSDDGTPAWASGTSEASAIVSAVIASMRAYAPALSAGQAQACVVSTAVKGGNLDAAAAFRACGLGAIVTQGSAAYQAAVTASAQVLPAQAPPHTALVRPSSENDATSNSGDRTILTTGPRVLHVHFRGRRLSVSVGVIPRGARVRLNVEQEGAGGHYRTTVSKTTAVRIARVTVGRWDRLAVLFVMNHARSPRTYVNRTSRLVSSSVADRALGGRGTI